MSDLAGRSDLCRSIDVDQSKKLFGLPRVSDVSNQQVWSACASTRAVDRVPARVRAHEQVEVA